MGHGQLTMGGFGCAGCNFGSLGGDSGCLIKGLRGGLRGSYLGRPDLGNGPLVLDGGGCCGLYRFWLLDFCGVAAVVERYSTGSQHHRDKAKNDQDFYHCYTGSCAAIGILRLNTLWKCTFVATYDDQMISLSSAEARARNIRVLIFDVDGVLTDGQLTFIPKLDGTAVETKGFHAHDGLGISLARLGGLRTGIITKRQSATVAIRARDLKLEFVYQGQAHKLSAAEEIAAKAGITLDELCYVGDDIVDLPVMRKCGLAIATANAREQVKEAAHWVTPLAGGQGAGRDAIEFILNAQGSLKRVVEQYLDADNPAARSSDIGTGNM
jgi:3-deoxy-D-manno-octulosonate 8-phosphate phosphatase (KDO 8-P phosphatase)